MSDLEIYLHIPFCVKKCNYCDFLSAPASEEVQARYMKALAAELSAASREAFGHEVVSVFIGGGTPSVADARLLCALLDILRQQYRLLPEAEITIEMNPGTADWEKLSLYRKAGINRLSIGLQSASDEELRRLGRIHTFEDFLSTYRLARLAGFSNINVDLMSALPGQSLASYENTLKKILALTPPPEHISAYSLIVEEGTPFYRMQETGELHLPDEDQEREMYYRTGALLEAAGYRRYEISNYARRGYECLHNKGYWKRTEYLGFGIGAASLFEEKRFRNSADLNKYLADPLGCRGEEEILSEADQMEEFLFLGLRLMEGITEESFFKKFHRSLMQVYGEVIRRNECDGLLEYREGRLRLTGRGIDISNYVLAQFLF